jgi:hypothetical protein
VYLQDDRRYVIESTCKYCGAVIAGNVYSSVRENEAHHAAECIKKPGQVVD